MSEQPPKPPENDDDQEREVPTEGERRAADEWEARPVDSIEKDRQKLLRKVEAEQASHFRPTPYEGRGRQRPPWSDDPEVRRRNYEMWVDEIRKERGLKPKYGEKDDD